MSKGKLFVIKLGSQVIVADHQEKCRSLLLGLVAEVAKLQRAGHRVILVSSGAIAFGRLELKYPSKLNLVQKQTAAAVGQPALLSLYKDLFKEQGLVAGQILLTAEDFSNRQRYLNIRELFSSIFRSAVVPIVNENDSVATAEIEDQSTTEVSFGDNDRLSALLAVNLQADLLVLFTNVAGIYTSNPFENPNAELIASVDNLAELKNINASGSSALGRGGMLSKIEASRIAAVGGVPVLIANGAQPEILSELINPDLKKLSSGTKIAPFDRPLSAKKNWIGFASGFRGILKINNCAKEVFSLGRSSLLAIGIVQVSGEFAAGSVVQIVTAEGAEIGRGIAEFSSNQIRLIIGKTAAEIKELNQAQQSVYSEVVVHKDYLVTRAEYEQ